MRVRPGTSLLKRTAKEVKHYRTLKRIIPLTMSSIAVLVTLVYLVSLMYSKFGSFTVSVDKYDQLLAGLSLSETRDFYKPTSRLDCRASEEITNISGVDLEKYNLGSVDGVDSGDDYLCYTFYCKNTGGTTVNFEYFMNIANMSMGVEKAIRVRIMTNINGENFNSTDYAKAKGVDENGNAIAEAGTEMFMNESTVMAKTVNDFKENDVMKFTVVIWIEGNDEDCLDSIIGGEFKIDMKFNVLNVVEDEKV